MHYISLALLLVASCCTLADDIPPPLPDEECQDWNPQCPVWKQYCTDPMNEFYMRENCKETCGWCPKCEDKSDKCSILKLHCNSHPMMKDMCALSCGFCKPKSTVAPTTLPPFTVGPAGRCGVPKIRKQRVINGEDAQKGAWPWQVLIKKFDQPHCGGSIVSPFYIVTAAHCVHKDEAITDQYKIVTGEHDFNLEEGGEMEIPAAKLIYHPKFSFKHLNYDIALIKLKWPVQFNRDVSTVCMPKKGDAPKKGQKCYITGWGKTSGYGQMHHILQQAKLPVVDNSKCHGHNMNGTGIAVTSNMLCAGFGAARPTGGCHGDSGGPFVCQNKNGQWTLHGAVSWGSGRCDTTEAYTVFSRIGEYKEWLDKMMREN